MKDTETQIRNLEEKVAFLESEIENLKFHLQKQSSFNSENIPNNLTQSSRNNFQSNVPLQAQPVTELFNNKRVNTQQDCFSQNQSFRQPFNNNKENIQQDYFSQNQSFRQPFNSNEQNIQQNYFSQNQAFKQPFNSNEQSFQQNQFYQPRAKKDWEKTIGKNVVGIIASTLIFISLILFSSIIFKDLSDTSKTILLFLGSFSVLGIGFFLQKKMANTFSLSVIGCGMGCIYLSLIICHIKFHFASQIVLYLLFLGWVLGMAFLFHKLQGTILCVIGQIGLSISILFGIFTVHRDVWLWFSLCLYTVVADILYFYICNLKTHKFSMHFINICTQFHLLLITLHNNDLYQRILEPETSFAIKFFFYLIGCVIFVFLLYYMYFYIRESFGIKRTVDHNGITHSSFSRLHIQNGTLCGKNSYEVLSFVSLISTYIGFTSIKNLIWEDLYSSDLLKKYAFAICDWMQFIFVLTLLISIIVFVEWVRHANKQITNNGTQVLLRMKSLFHTCMIPFLLILFIINSFEIDLEEQGILLFASLALLWYGFAKAGNLYRISGFMIFVLHTICFVDAPFYIWLITLFAYVAVYFIWAKYKKYYCKHYKAMLYALTFIFSLMFYSEFLNICKLEFPHSGYEVFFYILLVTPLQIAVLKTSFIRSWVNPTIREQNMYILARGINLFLLVLGTSQFYRPFPIWIYVLLILITSALCSVGMQELLKEHPDSLLTGFFVGFKYTTFIYAIIRSTHYDKGIFISISLLIIAIVFILLGFIYKLKSFRIYGLSLTMISVVKLVLVDISHENTMQTVLALLICGTLCFGINFIYNVLSKKFGD